MSQLLPVEVQGYLRHILHLVGMLIVARGGLDGENVDIYVGAVVNVISLIWFLYSEYKNRTIVTTPSNPSDDPEPEE